MSTQLKHKNRENKNRTSELKSLATKSLTRIYGGNGNAPVITNAPDDNTNDPVTFTVGAGGVKKPPQ